jgi:ATP-dependent Clp protease ATP-binding subunit ClpA
MVKELAEQLVPKKVTLELTPAGRAWLAEHGFDRLMGARPMGRLIQNEVKKPLAEKILFGELKEGGAVVLDAEDDHLTLTVKPSVPAEPAVG